MEAGSAIFNVKLKNPCNYPIRVVVPKYASFESERPLDKHLEIGQTKDVLNTDCMYCVPCFSRTTGYGRLREVLREDYTMTIVANGRETTFNSEQFLEIVKHAKKHYSSQWVIDDPSLCPTP
jgi:hypothetical protein